MPEPLLDLALRFTVRTGGWVTVHDVDLTAFPPLPHAVRLELKGKTGVLRNLVANPAFMLDSGDSQVDVFLEIKRCRLGSNGTQMAHQLLQIPDSLSKPINLPSALDRERRSLLDNATKERQLTEWSDHLR